MLWHNRAEIGILTKYPNRSLTPTYPSYLIGRSICGLPWLDAARKRTPHGVTWQVPEGQDLEVISTAA